MTVPTQRRSVWKSASLLIAFHKDQKREKRDAPYLWKPKDALARLFAKPEDQEAFVLVEGEDGTEDIQIKLHPDKMVVRREADHAWTGIVIEDHVVRVKVGGDWIEINQDGSVKANRDADVTYLERDGSIIKVNPDAEIIVSGDGSQMSRRTEDHIDAFTPDGIVSRRR